MVQPYTEKLMLIRANWIALVTQLDSCTEEELLVLLAREFKEECRPSFVSRIHSRFNRVRATREREQLASGSGIDIKPMLKAASNENPKPDSN